jgi:hypothetical protein
MKPQLVKLSIVSDWTEAILFYFIYSIISISLWIYMTVCLALIVLIAWAVC